MNENNDSTTYDDEEDSTAFNEPSDEYPGSFFCIPTTPSCSDTWSLN